MEPKITLRIAIKADLSEINRVIEAAVMSWQLPQRVKRLSLPSYYYDEADLLHLTLWVAEDNTDDIVAVAGYETADSLDTPKAVKGLLLHGLYVLPRWHDHGLGQQLLDTVERHAADGSYEGVLVKAQTEAVSFFEKQGYQSLPVEDSMRHYSYRLWKTVKN